MKKLTTTMTQRTLNKQEGRLTIGLDLGDRSSCYCVLDDVLMEQRLSTTPKAIKETFGAMPGSRTALEASESLQVTNFSNPTPISQLRQGPPEATYPHLQQNASIQNGKAFVPQRV